MTATNKAVGAMLMGELAAMSREQVQALPADQRALRVERLLADTSVIGVTRVSQILGHASSAGVRRLRNRYLASGGQVGPGFLPAPANAAETKSPAGQPTSGRSVDPVYLAGVIRTWGQQSGRLDADLFPVEGGRKSPGRPARRPDAMLDEATAA